MTPEEKARLAEIEREIESPHSGSYLCHATCIRHAPWLIARWLAAEKDAEQAFHRAEQAEIERNEARTQLAAAVHVLRVIRATGAIDDCEAAFAVVAPMLEGK